MCGIAGVLDPTHSTPAAELVEWSRAMAGTLSHRGPDDQGTWVDDAAGIAFGHRRLSIVDRSDLGHQPMVSRDGRWVLTYNGELYNAPELARDLAAAGVTLRSRCDTEVLVEAVAAWGLAAALDRADGMWAFGLWDREMRALTLVRDRLGEKPLFYGWAGSSLVFGSELKALRAHPWFRPTVDRGALALYLRLGYLPAPHCIYLRAAKLAAGSLVVANRDATTKPPVRYWSLDAVVAARGDEPQSQSRVARASTAASATDRLDGLLRESVERRLRADVEVGTFLSGGVDSTTVAALVRAGGRSGRTFTIAFDDPRVDEAAPAAAIAHHLGTDHTEIPVSARDAQAVIPELARWYDEPFADPSAIPTMVLARTAAAHVTVCLSGDGGDELWGGYRRYQAGHGGISGLQHLPRPARHGLSSLLLGVRPGTWDRVVGAGQPLVPPNRRIPNPGDKAHKLGRILAGGRGPDAAYAALVTHWDHPANMVPGAHEPYAVPPVPEVADPVERMMARDTVWTLPDQMLAKVDRASMASSLEVRVPMLDHRVVELAWSLPLDLRLGGGGAARRSGKRMLRRLLARYVPPALTDRPKMGFDPPIGDWLKGPLRPWAERLLDADRLSAEGYLEPAPIRACWAEHLSGRRNWDYRLWTILMFETWLETWPASG